jgi:hypothetical protein
LRRFIAIFFLFTYLSAYCEMHELLKLPFLLEHFSEHKAKNAEMTLADFLYIHYVDQLKNTDDFQDDLKLPFRQADITGVLVFHFEPQELIFLPIPAFPDNQYKMYYPERYSNIYPFDIFQPPRFSA